MQSILNYPMEYGYALFNLKIALTFYRIVDFDN